MWHYLFNRTKARQYYLLLGDTAMIFISVVISYWLRQYITDQAFVSFHRIVSRLDYRHVVVLLSHLFSLYLFNQYNLNQKFGRSRIISNMVISTGLAGLIMSGVLFFFPKYIFGRQVLLIYMMCSLIFMVAWRLLSLPSLMKFVRPKKLSVIGVNERLFEDIKAIINPAGTGMALSDTFFVKNQESGGEAAYQDEIGKFIETGNFDILSYDTTFKGYGDKLIQTILSLKYQNKEVYDLPTLIQNITGKIPVDFIDGQWLLNNEKLQGQESRPYAKLKRFFDVVFSLLLIITTLPICLIVGIIIRVDGKGPVLFIQRRLGLKEKEFNCMKFRTMVENAEKENEPAWSRGDNDPRITRIGRFLRKMRLDELPQLINILRGEMSFIGPRPIRRQVAEALSRHIPYYDLRFSVKPGLSGWAQVNVGYAGTIEEQKEKFMYELFYIQHMSLFFDILTAVKTIRKVIWGEGK